MSPEFYELLFTVKPDILYPVLRAHSPDAARNLYLTHTVLCSSTFTLSLNTLLMLRRSTTRSVACDHKNVSSHAVRCLI